jgi:hypothetical protein
MEYPWYQKIAQSDDLQQGDLIPECPIVIPPDNFDTENEADIDIQLIDSIVLSQSCDLVNNKLSIVLVCPYYTLRVFLDSLEEQADSKRKRDKIIDNLRKGHLPGYHLINKDNTNAFDYQVIDFKNVYGVHIDTLKKTICKLPDRIRLLPPYREHLSQAFARYFMRVGLPQDILIDETI